MNNGDKNSMRDVKPVRTLFENDLLNIVSILITPFILNEPSHGCIRGHDLVRPVLPSLSRVGGVRNTNTESFTYITYSLSKLHFYKLLLHGSLTSFVNWPPAVCKACMLLSWSSSLNISERSVPPLPQP